MKTEKIIRKINFILSLFVTFSISCSLFAQDNNFIKHTVSKGETINEIATKYKVTPYDIYKLNPDSQTGLKESDVLLIPTVEEKETVLKQESKPVSKIAPKPKVSNSNPKTHITKPKENLYSISRDYNVSVEELKSLNEAALKDGLKIGQVIKIPSGEATSITESKPVIAEIPVVKKVTKEPTVSKSGKGIYHIVEPKETKFGIAKKYGITVQELEERNPDIVSNLTIGFKLLISGDEAKKAVVIPEVQKPKPVIKEIIQQETVVTEVIRTQKFNGFANYEVKPKETLYSLSQSFNISQEELMTLNPTLKDGVRIGMILKVPGKGKIVNLSNSNAKFSDLTKTINAKDKKQLVLLLPFNASKIQGDTLKTIGVRLKKDAFLNMTLDFYSGALMAIDSAKTLGINVEVKIFDSEESKLTSNVVNVVKNNNLQEANAIIGPFYQQYVEKVAELLNDANVPVISPLSKEIGKSYSNLYQAMPPSDFTKTAMFDFMIAKGGNIIVVSDPKKIANKEFITKKYPSAKFVPFTETGALDIITFKTLLVKDKMNYVVMDSERTGMILSTTNVLLNELVNFQIQLVIIEPNGTLDFEEISMKRLTILKMLYPSLTRENDSPEAVIFENQYKEKNKVFPSQFATRGFDITFDTLLRLSQGKSFEVSANEDKTEQVESKFEYSKKNSEGYTNKGVYIMEFQEDLSVKQVN
ncbi:LysM peptidoglycan-binding domain-containing protein [Flavobacterium luteum]|uniref:LysM peptidoglycan-binding domain-containing protein n=1 Tax=Flavobacterium luteum TaxID=2026654 RepID=UPI001CD9EBF6|nr:LysM peptidoglycan-binding domain-containing protein [Flavobacterium luteum]